MSVRLARKHYALRTGFVQTALSVVSHQAGIDPEDGMAFLAEPGVRGTRCRTRSATAAAQASLNCKWQAFLGWNEFEVWDGAVGLVPACSAPLQLFIYSITLLSKFWKGRDMSIIAVLNPKGGCGRRPSAPTLRVRCMIVGVPF